MKNQLHRHYSLLLGLDTPWKVTAVDLQIEASKVVIQVEHNGGREPCAECGNTRKIKVHAAECKWRMAVKDQDLYNNLLSICKLS